MLNSRNKKKGLITLIVLLVLSLIMLSIQIKGKEKATLLSNVVDTAVYPLQYAIEKSGRFIKGSWNHYIYLINAHEENQKLKKKVREYESKISKLEEYGIENKRLKKMLDFKQSVSGTMVPARVVGKDFSSWFKTISIDRGRKHGITNGLAVVTPSGIVGHIVSASSYTSRVLLITDPNSGVAVINQRNRTQGVVSGGSGSICRLKFISRNTQVQMKDLFISSGLGGIFPKGLTVGKVIRISENKKELFQSIDILPAVVFSKLEEVFIIEKNMGEK